MLLPPHLDHHLAQAGHDGSGPKVSEVGHPVARTEPQARAARAPRTRSLFLALWGAGVETRV